MYHNSLRTLGFRWTLRRTLGYRSSAGKCGEDLRNLQMSGLSGIGAICRRNFASTMSSLQSHSIAQDQLFIPAASLSKEARL